MRSNGGVEYILTTPSLVFHSLWRCEVFDSLILVGVHTKQLFDLDVFCENMEVALLVKAQYLFSEWIVTSVTYRVAGLVGLCRDANIWNYWNGRVGEVVSAHTMVARGGVQI